MRKGSLRLGSSCLGASVSVAVQDLQVKIEKPGYEVKQLLMLVLSLPVFGEFIGRSTASVWGKM